MKFSLRFKNHDSVLKLIIGIIVVVAIVIIANIIMNMMADKPINKADSNSIKGNDFITQSKLNASKNDIFLLK